MRGQRVVGHHQHGLAVLAHEPVEQLEDLVRALAVEVAGGLVAEQERGIGHDRARDAHPLLLAAGELPRVVLHAVAEADDVQRRLHVPAAIRLREPGQQQRQLDVLEGGEHRDQVVHLEHEAHVARAPRGELAEPTCA